MPSLFSITTTTNTVRLDEKRQGKVTFTVSNVSEHPLRGRPLIRPEDPKAADWLSLKGVVERSLPEDGTERYTVKLNVPENAPAGSYSFRLDMVNVERPDEDYARGQMVIFEVPEDEPERKRFPIWIALVGLFVALVVFLLWPREGATHRRVTLTFDTTLSVHSWNLPGDGIQFLDLNRYNFRTGVSHTEDMPPAGKSITLLTFSTQGLNGDQVLFGSLHLGTADVVGDPFASHGNLLIEEVSFADLMIAPHTFTALNELFSLPRPPIQPEDGVGETLDITQELKASLERGSQRFQIRLRFEDVDLETIDAAIAAPDTYVEWSHTDVYLRVTTGVPYRQNVLW